MRPLLSTVLVSIALLSAALLAIVPTPASAEDRRVGAAETYATVDAALRDAVDGDRVVVTAGTYAESSRPGPTASPSSPRARP